MSLPWKDRRLGLAVAGVDLAGFAAGLELFELVNTSKPHGRVRRCIEWKWRT